MQRILFIIFLFIFSGVAHSESVFPLKLNNFSEIQGGKTVLAVHQDSDSLIIYNLIFDFTKGNESISISGNDSLKSKKGLIISNSHILTHELYFQNLIFVTQESAGIYISMMNPEGKRYGRTKITENELPNLLEQCQLISLIANSEYLLNLNGLLYKVKIENDIPLVSFLKIINGKILKLDNSSGFNSVEYAVIEENNIGLIINFFDYNSEFQFMTKIESFENGSWADLGTMLAYLTSPDASQTFVQIIDKKSGLITTSFWIDAESQHISLRAIDNMITAVYIETSNDGYNICRSEINVNSSKNLPQKVPLSGNLINPLNIRNLENEYIVVFSNSVMLVDDALNTIAYQFYPIENKLNNIDDIIKISNNIYLLSIPNSLKISILENKYWQIRKVYAEFKNYFLPIILSLLLLLFIQMYRHQRRLANELLDLPNIGLLFVVDSSGRLINLNNVAKEFLEISNNIPLRKYFGYYAKSPKTLLFAEIINKSLETKDSNKQKINIMIDDAETEWICKTIPLRNITGMFRGVVLSAVDITEQLERKRLSNWAQLAHDMQTNLSTIKLNAEHLDIELSENNQNRQRRIIFQVNLLMQRVRDIVTVGRSDTLNLETHSVNDICNEVRKEFDELMFPDIKFELDCKNFLILCDKPKLIRAVRNAAENGIKAMKGNPGTIKIIATQEKGYSLIKVEDTGVGMDEEIKKKMLIPYFTTAGKTGGSGIGTMIMQHVTELHGGFLIINSEKGVGTQVIFHIPNSLLAKKEKLINSDD